MRLGRGRRPFAGQHAVVTGGAAGIGFEVAKELVRRRAAAVSVLDVHGAEEAAAELQGFARAWESPARVCGRAADVCDFEQVRTPGRLTRMCSSIGCRSSS